MHKKNFKLGATGEYPQGKMNEEDEGELRMGVAADVRQRIVMINFGKPVSWLGLSVQDTEQFIEMLQGRIEEIKNGGS